MGRILISAGHGGYENGAIDPGIVAAGTTEAREMIWLREATAQVLQQRGVEVLMVPDDLSLQQSIAWINARARPGDLALEIHLDGSSNLNVRGTTVYFIANNSVRQAQAATLLRSLLTRVPQLQSRGALPDTATGLGNRLFCRQLTVPSLLIEVGFLTNATDRAILKNQGWGIATGIAEGMQQVLLEFPAQPYTSIQIIINTQLYSERGVLINGNAYIPVDLADRLGVKLAQNSQIVRIRYQNIVYFKAIDLRQFNVSVGWDQIRRAVTLRTNLLVSNTLKGQIMGLGSTLDPQMVLFLKTFNLSATNQFPDLPRLYREEANAEGVNFDLAFAQMCVETDFLQFSSITKASQNNFGGLGALGGNPEGASFPSARIGVRAHIQHLKAYASTEPLVNAVVDPRFSFVPRGVASTVSLLSGRWEADLNYGEKILSRTRQLYEIAGLL